MKGDRKGQYSIRVNDQWRLCFRWQDGEVLREEFMQPMGISINHLAREIYVPPGRISEIVNGKRCIRMRPDRLRQLLSALHE